MWNAAYNHLQFWDGRARDLEEQAGKPIEDPNEMAQDPEERIQDAIDAARPGDTVAVMPGVYHETLTLDLSGITLAGEVIDGKRAVLDGRGVLTDGIIGSGSALVFALGSAGGLASAVCAAGQGLVALAAPGQRPAVAAAGLVVGIAATQGGASLRFAYPGLSDATPLG